MSKSSAVLAVVLVASLAACSGSNSVSSQKSDADGPTPAGDASDQDANQQLLAAAEADGYQNGQELRSGGFGVYGGADGNTFLAAKARDVCADFAMTTIILQGGLPSLPEREAFLDGCVEGMKF